MTALFNRQRQPGRFIDPVDRPWVIGGFAGVAFLTLLVAALIDLSALDMWTGLIMFIVLLTISVPLLSWVARKEGDQWLFKVLYGALVLHLLFSIIRYFFIFGVYKGSGDAGRYHEAGVTFVDHLKAGLPLHPIKIMEGFPVESQRLGDFTGVLYMITGPSAYAGFFFYTFLCFGGLVLMIRAFKVAVPEGDYRRYTLLLMFLPSLLFWPASIGKEALMIACVGVIAYGGALLLAPKPQARGAVFFVVGTLLVTLVRPHVALMSLAGLVLAMMVGVLTSPAATERLGTRGRLLRIVALVVMLALASVVVSQLGSALQEKGVDASASATLDKATKQSAIGNSEFAPPAVTSPTKLPFGLVSVFFRPFPWEARNMNSLIAAVEGLILAAVFALSWRRLLSFPKLAARRPYLVFSMAYVVAFVIGFSFLANFGILARQRVQALPALLVLVALPPFVSKARARVEQEPTGDTLTAVAPTDGEMLEAHS